MAEQQESTGSLPLEPIYVEEPHRARGYAEVLSRAAVEHQTVIVRRRGVAYAAVISLEHLQTLQDALARQEAENLAAQIDWSRVAKAPPAEWLEGDEPKPF
jgi:PHD/YefM family antitoxin component YafN of YafNO toxin-antitoxin module